MATTFARLCQQVDQTQKELEAEIRRLTANIDQLEHVQRVLHRLKLEKDNWLLASKYYYCPMAHSQH
jgi:uncharacterized protein HemX